jgi:DNA-directed RNA polymerase subunit M/transcription elongation factor TFIIS
MKKVMYTPGGDDVVCPECGTKKCWYTDNETDRDDNEIIVEIWLCENGDKFRYSIRDKP